MRCARALPSDDTLLAPRLHALAESSQDRWPSAEQPVGKADVGARLGATLFVIEQRRTPPESVRAHPAAADFPGLVPVDAPRLARSLTIDTTVPRWHSTGLYAAPGELITVTVPAAVGAAGGFHVRVGAHSDGLWWRPEWTRMPEISRRFPVSAPTTLVANAFGGLIYIEVPTNAGLGNVPVEIEGAVAAPRFVLGETDLAVWRNEIRHAPAPWAEIEGRNMIVTTDAREVRGLDDPAAVAETWDRILDLSAELAVWPKDARSSPERFVVDRQISVGYMHAGYPLMAHLDQQANLVNAEHLRTCAYEPTQSNWGFFHEVGHNHQSGDWTFDGTVEVTVNLFTLYVYEFLCGIPVAENWRGSPAFRTEQMMRYDFDDPDYEQWKSEPFLALVMYEQLQQAFGWEACQKVFATYLALPDDERPKNDDEKRDQWLVRFSRQVHRNLGPFFEAWGVPTSQQARDSITHLPAWLPPGFPPDNSRAGASLPFTLEDREDSKLPGHIDLISVTASAFGQEALKFTFETREPIPGDGDPAVDSLSYRVFIDLDEPFVNGVNFDDPEFSWEVGGSSELTYHTRGPGVSPRIEREGNTIALTASIRPLKGKSRFAFFVDVVDWNTSPLKFDQSKAAKVSLEGSGGPLPKLTEAASSSCELPKETTCVYVRYKRGLRMTLPLGHDIGGRADRTAGCCPSSPSCSP